MKIGLLSLIPEQNYGGILQSYALKVILERMGHNVSVIYRSRYVNPWRPVMFFKYAVRAFRKYILGRNIDICPEKWYNEWEANTYAEMRTFCKARLNLRAINRFKDIGKDEFDAIVVGSDQVWRPKYFKEQYLTSIADAYLKFAMNWNIRRIAYAASFGVDNWEYDSKETEECARLLKKFDAVSVREYGGVKLCKDYLNVTARCLCDPTMLLTKADYEKLVDPSISKRGDLFVYCLDESEEFNSLVDKISEENSFVPYTNNGGKTRSCVKGSVESWLRGLMDAKFVITDSFHACVFSLIFQKPFIVLGNKERGLERFASMLKTFGQSHRLLYCASDYDENKDYMTLDNIDNVLSCMREESIQFLTDAFGI